MSDWQVGDLAVCVFCEPGPKVDPWEPQVGSTYTVAEVIAGLSWDDGAPEIGLEFEEDPARYPDTCWSADWFRKIRPDEQEACEPEFVTLLKRIKRTVKA